MAAPLDHLCGECDLAARVISIDLAEHSSDRKVRATLLHEMAHAAAGRPGHGSPFWAQLEYLLAQHASITVSFPELGERGRHLSAIPERFRRCRRRFAPAYRRDQLAMEREFAGRWTSYTAADLETEAYDWAIDGAPWRGVWWTLAHTWGYVDLDGKVLPQARPYRAAARRGYIRGRRFWLKNERLKARMRRERA